MDGDQFDAQTGEISASLSVPAAIAAAIIAVKKQVKQLGADDKNEHGRYNFVSVDKFYERIGKLMAEAGLALLIDENASEVRISGKSDNPWLFVQYNLAFMHASGVMSWPMRRSLALPINGPQTYGAAQSYIEKQFLRQVFKVPTGERDADETKQEEGAAPESRYGARAERESAAAPRAAHGRPQAAPARSPAQEMAAIRYKELVAAIDAADLGELASIDVSLDGDLSLTAVPQFAVMIEQLRSRINAQHKRLRTDDELNPFR